MDRLKNRNLMLLLLLLLLNVFFVDGYHGGREDQPHKLSLFSMLTTTTSTYCDKLKALLNQARAYFIPPSIDFRSSSGEAKEDAGGHGGGGGGATEKVKEAVASSLGKSQQTFEDSARTAEKTFEDSARTAAEIAGETMEKIKDKVKKTFSKTSPQPEPEL